MSAGMRHECCKCMQVTNNYTCTKCCHNSPPPRMLSGWQQTSREAWADAAKRIQEPGA